MKLFHTITIALLLSSCDFNPTELNLQQGWSAQSIAAWRDYKPDMMVFSKDGKTLYVSCENHASLLAPSLISIDLQSYQRQILLYGLNRADGLKQAPDGSLWIGEEAPDGLIWRLTEPGKFPIEQRVDRTSLQTSHPAIAPLHRVGRFSHEGFTFSINGRYAYLADEWEEGCLYRYDMETHKLFVLHQTTGWVAIRQPENARQDAEKLHAQYFNRIEDMETLPDGRILMAETGTGKILILDDRNKKVKIDTYLSDARLLHPDNLAWDEQRQWLWITDDDSPSYLWVWDGQQLNEIAQHSSAEITGVAIHQGDIFINLQRNFGLPEVLLRLHQNNSSN
ncbi:MAG: hypothetical protein R8K49_01985 [Mariprofundaceae bacterium]